MIAEFILEVINEKTVLYFYVIDKEIDNCIKKTIMID